MSVEAQFTQGETKLLLSILRNLKGDINSDWDVVAAENGHKDASISKTRWSQVRRKKIDGNIPAASSPSSAGVKKAPAKRNTKSTPKAKKEPASSEEDDGVMDSPSATASAKKNAKKATTTKNVETIVDVKQEMAEDEDSGVLEDALVNEVDNDAQH